MNDNTDLLGYLAAGLVLVTVGMRSPTALRAVAILGNLVLMACALVPQLPPLVLHALLLP
jgi:hypothetical protein